MDLDIQDSLEEIFKNIKIEVEYLEFRRYQIRIVVDAGEYIITFKYDANLTYEKENDIITMPNYPLGITGEQHRIVSMICTLWQEFGSGKHR